MMHECDRELGGKYGSFELWKVGGEYVRFQKKKKQNKTMRVFFDSETEIIFTFQE